MATSTRAVLVEDSEVDRAFADRLTRLGLPCEHIAPPAARGELIARIEKGKYGLVILDYRLDDRGPGTYRGGTVAADLKERCPGLPIVLFTTAEKRKGFVENNPALRELFDFVVMKESIAEKKARALIVEQLIDLAKGFKRINRTLARTAKAGGFERVAKLMESERDELEGVRGEIQPDNPNPAEVCRLILKELIAYPGPLVDDSEARALLGVDLTSFRKSKLQEILEDSRYKGVFSKIAQRWWKVRLQSVLSSRPVDKDVVDWRPRALAKLCGSRIRSGGCVWCGEPEIIHGCDICGESVDGRHSLTANDASRPRWADPKLVCYRCVQTGRADPNNFSGASAGIAQRLASGAIRPPEARRDG